MDKKTFAYGFLIFFIVLTYYLYSNNDAVASIIALDGVKGVAYYILSNPAYLLLITSVVLVNREAGTLKNIIGTLMIIYASDIISYPRLSPSGMSDSVHLLASLDGVMVAKLIEKGMEYSTAYTLYYLILPIALIVGAMGVLGIRNFFKSITNSK